MAFSPLIDKILKTGKHSSRLGRKVSRVIVHHWAGTNVDWVLNKMVHAANKSSVSYLILSDGTLIGSVDEKYRPWTSNGFLADGPAITVEIQNSTTGPDWKVSDAALETLHNLIADIAKRHKWKQIRKGKEVRGHREFYATSCPGPYLWPRLSAIAAEAQRRFKGGTGGGGGMSKPTPAPSKPAATKRWPQVELLVDGDFGPLTKRAYQVLLAGIDIYRGNLDSDFARLSIIAEQTWLTRLGWYKGRIDGDRGPLTIRALQGFLKRKGHYKGLIDGDFGPLTVKALQAYLNKQRRYFK